MCLKRKTNKLLISRSFRSLSGNYFIGISKKKIDRVLVIDLKCIEGSINFKLTNLVTNEELINKPVETGNFEFEIESNNKYQLVISSKRASGSYRVYLKAKL